MAMHYANMQNVKAKLKDREDLGDGLAMFSFETSERVPYRAGQYIALHINSGENKIIRPYSIALSNGTLNFYIRRVDTGGRRPDGRGLFTTELFSMAEGYELELSKAKGHFVIDDKDPRDILFISSGTGLAPITSILDELYKAGTSRLIVLVNGMRHFTDIASYSNLFDEYARDANFNFNFVPVVSRDLSWSGERGHVQDTLRREDAESRLSLRFNPENTVVYVCGLPAMVNDVTDFFSERDFRTARQKAKPDIITEKY